MALQEGIEQNFRFLVLEVGRQLDDAERVLDAPTAELVESVYSSDDYIDNLKGIIEGKCFTFTLESRGDKRRIDLLKAVDVATANLERIADFAVNIVGQSRYLSDPAFIRRFDYSAHFREVRAAVALVFEALFERNITLALKICEAEYRLDDLFAADFQRVMEGLKAGVEVENHVTTLFILRYFERMGDSLLNIGEAIISAAMGERLKIHQFQALEESLEAVDDEADLEDFAFESMGETRSGCRIARLAPREKGVGDTLIFKEGNLKKLERERRNLERWNELEPGLPPKVLAFHEHGGNASLLMEYLEGETLQDIALRGSDETVRGAMQALTSTLGALWTKTRRAGALRRAFVRQTRKRLSDVYAVHP
ncbi:MAG: phosphate uptake regulator PhoU, partial [Candidatus Methylomirabilis sp.]|nr:phosphate uptake regulator PhoU [Deltaproteobacteria bacterium]